MEWLPPPLPPPPVSAHLAPFHPQEKTNSLIDTYQDIIRLVDELATCPYDQAAFSAVLDKIQAIVRGRLRPDLVIQLIS